MHGLGLLPGETANKGLESSEQVDISFPFPYTPCSPSISRLARNIPALSSILRAPYRVQQRPRNLSRRQMCGREESEMPRACFVAGACVVSSGQVETKHGPAHTNTMVVPSIRPQVSLMKRGSAPCMSSSTLDCIYIAIKSQHSTQQLPLYSLIIRTFQLVAV